jgi:hypothetical protein
MSLVIHPLTFVDLPARVGTFPLAVTLVIDPVTFVDIPIRVGIFAQTMILAMYFLGAFTPNMTLSILPVQFSHLYTFFIFLNINGDTQQFRQSDARLVGKEC